MLDYIIILMVVVMIYIIYMFCNSDERVFFLPRCFDKPNCGIFYNPLIEDTRVFYLGERVYCNGKKFSIVGYEVTHYTEIRITKLTLLPENTTNETKYYNIGIDGFVTDSRRVKEIIKCQLILFYI